MLDIPGYKIEHELGRGGMAKVYLAVQESVQRRVALKVMSPVLLVDPSFSARFMREARIAANLTHPHVVAVFNVGAHEDSHFIAMEFVPGGDLAARCMSPMRVPEALRIAREIAGALDYAHAKGFVHRDVKPENILFRDNDGTVLTDFGIARAVNSNTQMTKTGAVIGTPQYMSPEQARGKDLDGRSDLYGLGIVLYEMLTGKVPYEGSDSVSVGIKHVTDPLPRLPAGLIQVQPLLERFLAKDPNHRYQTGDEAVLDIQRMEKALEHDEPVRIKLSPIPGMNTTFTDPPTKPMPAPVPKSEQKSKSEKSTPARVSATPHPDGTLRQEPTLGSIDEISSFDRTMRQPSQVEEPKRAPETRKTGGGGKWLLALLVLVSIIAGVGWWQQERVLALFPGEEIAALLQRAEAASQLGQMYGNSDRHASELFKQVLEIDPGNTKAQRGLLLVADYLVKESEKARRDGFPQQANFFWERARELNPALPITAPEIVETPVELDDPVVPDTRADPDTNDTRITALLADAMRLIVEERLLQPANDNALAKLQAVLAIEPNNPAAKDGLQQITDRISTRIERALTAGELDLAAQHIEQLAQVGYDDSVLATYQGKLQQSRAAVMSREQAATRQQDQLDDQIARAARALSADRLSSPENDNAVYWYRQVLASDPGNAAASRGLTAVARRYLALTEQALEDDRLAVAAGYIKQIRAIDPGLGGLGAVDKRLALYQQQRERNQASALKVQEIKDLLAEAQVAFDRGDLMAPPGNSAYDRYKDVLRLDPNQQGAREGLRRLSDSLAENARRAMLAGDFERAGSYLGDAQQIDPQNAPVMALTPELASAVREKVLEAITENRLDDAETLLAIARRLEPDHPQVSRLQLQLSVAKG